MCMYACVKWWRLWDEKKKKKMHEQPMQDAKVQPLCRLKKLFIKAER